MVGIRTGPVQSRWTTLATTTIMMMKLISSMLVILVAVHVRTMQPVRTMNSCGRQSIFSWSNTCREQGSSFRKKLLLGCQTCWLAFLATVSMRGWFVSLLVITGLQQQQHHQIQHQHISLLDTRHRCHCWQQQLLQQQLHQQQQEHQRSCFMQL